MKYRRDTALPCPYPIPVVHGTAVSLLDICMLLLPAIDRTFGNNTSIGLSGLLDDKFVVSL